MGRINVIYRMNNTLFFLIPLSALVSLFPCQYRKRATAISDENLGLFP